MQSDTLHLPVGIGLDIFVSDGNSSALVPMAMIEIQDDAATFPDVGSLLVLRVTAERLIRMLGNGPGAEALLAEGYAYTAVYQSGMVRRIADDILHAPYHGPTLSNFIEGKALELLSLLVEAMPDSSGDRIALSVCDTLRSDLQNPPPVAEVARMNGVTPRKLREYFQSCFGMTIPSWVSHWRMIRAREMLLDSYLPIKDVAAAVGYTQATTFTRQFTKQFGTPPSRIRFGTRNPNISTAESPS